MLLHKECKINGYFIISYYSNQEIASEKFQNPKKCPLGFDQSETRVSDFRFLTQSVQNTFVCWIFCWKVCGSIPLNWARINILSWKKQKIAKIGVTTSTNQRRWFQFSEIWFLSSEKNSLPHRYQKVSGFLSALEFSEIKRVGLKIPVFG